jgi:Ca2+-binding EF-hand superfamily protein
MTQQSNKGGSSRHPADIKELRREFALADRNHDDRINIVEFRRLLEGLQAGMSERDMEIGFREVDTDRDGLIDREEFIRWWSED